MTPDWTEAIDRALSALERIATALEAQHPPPEPETPPQCPHPEESRIDFGWTNGQRDWQCEQCGYRTVP